MEITRERVKFPAMKPKKIFTPAQTAEKRATPPPTPEQIAALAHAIWIDRGRPEGRDLEHWLDAKRQLTGEMVPAPEPEVLDPDVSPAARIDRELDRIASPGDQRSATSL